MLLNTYYVLNVVHLLFHLIQQPYAEDSLISHFLYESQDGWVHKCVNAHVRIQT